MTTEERGRGRYSKVSRRIWNSQSFKALSQPKPSAAWLFIRLLTGPELSNIPGLFQAWDVGIAKSLKWPQKAFDEAFSELEREGLAHADWEVGLVWLPRAIAHNEPESPNVVVSWRTAWAELPDCDLKTQAKHVLTAWALAKGEAWSKALAKAFGEASTEPTARPKREPSAYPRPNQIQEQKQEQEQKQKQIPQTPTAAATGASEVPPDKPRNLQQAMAFAVCERAEFVASEPHLAEWTDPHKWPEVQRIAATLAKASGQSAPKLSRFSRDAGVRAVVELFAAGYSEQELERAAKGAPLDPWWSKDGAKRGLSSLSPEVVRRVLNATQGANPGPALNPRLERELEQSRRAAALSRGEVEL